MRSSSRALEASLFHYAPLPPARVILNGRDGARYRPAEKHAFVLTAGRVWDEAKNVAALECAAPRLGKSAVQFCPNYGAPASSTGSLNDYGYPATQCGSLIATGRRSL